MSKMSSSNIATGLAVALMACAPAIAQDAPQPAPAPTAPAAAAPPAAVAAPAEAQPAAAPAALADPAATPPAEVVAAKPAEPPPTLPTTGDGAIITTLLSKVCEPVAAGGNIEQLAKAAGMAKDRRTQDWVMSLSQKPFQVAITPLGERNKNVCEMKVRYAPGWDQPIIDAMNIWRFLHEPQLHLARNDIAAHKDAQRTTTTWDNWANQSFDGKMIGLVLVQLNKPDGSAIDKNFDEALVQFSTRAALPASVAQPAPPPPPVAQQTPTPPAPPAS